MIPSTKLDNITKPRNAAAVLVHFLKNQNKTHSGIQIMQSLFQFLHNFIKKQIRKRNREENTILTEFERKLLAFNFLKMIMIKFD